MPIRGFRFGCAFALIAKEHSEDLEKLRDLLETGSLTPVIDKTFPLDEVPEAIRYLEDGRARGKIVITVAPTGSE